MTGALVILAAMIVVGLLLYITDVKYFRHHHSGNMAQPSSDSQEGSPSTKKEEICCGLHLVCEKTSLQLTSDEIIYYDDEELDRYAGKASDSYTNEEIEEFRDVLLTLLPQDVAGWAKSITLRKIELPSEVKDELLLLMTDLRTQSV